jgi:hypothetical protein
MRALPFLLLAGCAFGTGTPGEVDPANLPAVVTWDAHIHPMMVRYCIGCHGATFQGDDLDLRDYLDVRCEYGEVREEVAGGEMPPAPAKQPDAWDRAMLAQWQADGFPMSVDAAGFAVDGPTCGGG